MSRQSRDMNRDPLVWLSLAAGVGFTATAEYHLARTIGATPPVAVLLPLALDVYVIAAIRRSRGRDIALSLMLMGVAQVAAHMLEADVVKVSVPLVAAVSLLVPLSIWRVHALAVLPAKHKPGTAAPVDAVPHPASVPPPPPAPQSVPAPVLEPAASLPELHAVPEQKTDPVPVRRAPSRKRTSTTAKKTGRGTAPKTGTGTASFDEHVRTATAWLKDNPDLSGTDIGTRLGTKDSYGRRVKRAALATGTGTPAAGREHRPPQSDGEGLYL